MCQGHQHTEEAELGYPAQVGRPPHQSKHALWLPNLEEYDAEFESQRETYEINQETPRYECLSPSYDQMGSSLWKVQSLQLG